MASRDFPATARLSFSDYNYSRTKQPRYRMCLSSPMLFASTKNSSWLPFSNLLKCVFDVVSKMWPINTLKFRHLCLTVQYVHSATHRLGRITRLLRARELWSNACSDQKIVSVSLPLTLKSLQVRRVLLITCIGRIV